LYVFNQVWLKWPSPSSSFDFAQDSLEAATHSLIILLGGSLKAEGFGDGFSLAKYIPLILCRGHKRIFVEQITIRSLFSLRIGR
jgi:hypothetical protein